LAVVLFLSQALNQQERLRAHRLEEAALRAPLHR
jgi:hypothetical protein